jgi:hypothetical protein
MIALAWFFATPDADPALELRGKNFSARLTID